MNFSIKIFNYVYALILKKLLPLIAFTLVNYAISIEIIGSFPLFFIRETIIFLLLLAIDYWGNELALLNKQDEEIHSLIYRDQPILRYAPYLRIFLISLIVFLSISNMDNQFSQLIEVGIKLLGMLIYLSVLLFLSYLNAIFSNPKVFDYYNLAKAVKINGFRSFSTASSFIHVCKICIKGAGTLLACDVALPIFIEGDTGARGFTSNFLSERYGRHGIKSYVSADYRHATYLLDRYPEERSNIITSDNWVNPRDLPKIYQKYKLTPPATFGSAEVGVRHDFSFYDLFKKKK